MCPMSFALDASLSARIFKVIESQAAEPSYVMQYHCRSLEEYHHYRDNFAAALQKEHSDKFAGRFRGARQLLEEVAQAIGAPEEQNAKGGR